MRRFRSSVSLLLCIAVIASMFSGFLVASAAPLKSQSIACDPAKIASLTVESKQPQQDISCCIIDKTKLASRSAETKQTISNQADECCLPFELPVRGKSQIGSRVADVDPCAPPVVDTSCGISYPAGSVVGEIPFNQQAYYAPGLAASGVTINAGTYWVTGLGKAANGDGYYQVVIACQYLFVPATDVIPSYQAPWSGQPLPTTPPVEN